ncbi:BRICHOS domain-containing protein 5-like [Salarias fasciatus]|uniref:BRICHOS domain-containing protein 5-like n=1 Tax=Salarias fasciatus TaxID=181472 RepID=UPI001176E8F5|nr:BRICHOS domain-containing protein 5-like [Salarias fasciatus]
MVRCWQRSEEAQSADGGPDVPRWSHYFPLKAFWVSLSAFLLLLVVTLLLTLLPQPHAQPSHTVRISASDQTGAPINQSAVVDQQNDVVVFSVTSSANRTSTVLFDVKHGLVCYKPVHQDSCFLRQMEQSDYDNVNSLLQQAAPQQSQIQLSGKDMQRQTEFLGVLAASQVNVSSLEEPLQALCQDRPVHWTRRAEGPGKQRLVYFCIDICFPSNICVSVCFYYLPE